MSFLATEVSDFALPIFPALLLSSACSCSSTVWHLETARKLYSFPELILLPPSFLLTRIHFNPLHVQQNQHLPPRSPTRDRWLSSSDDYRAKFNGTVSCTSQVCISSGRLAHDLQLFLPMPRAPPSIYSRPCFSNCHVHSFSCSLAFSSFPSQSPVKPPHLDRTQFVCVVVVVVTVSVVWILILRLNNMRFFNTIYMFTSRRVRISTCLESTKGQSIYSWPCMHVQLSCALLLLFLLSFLGSSKTSTFGHALCWCLTFDYNAPFTLAVKDVRLSTAMTVGWPITGSAFTIEIWK